MTKNVFRVLVVAGALLFFGARANAGTCTTDGSGNLVVPVSSCTVVLDQVNTSQLAGVQVTATITNNGTSGVDLNFTLTNDPTGSTFQGFIDAGWSGTDAATAIPSKWKDEPGKTPHQMDGFGQFYVAYAFSGKGTLSSIDFTLPSGTSSFNVNTDGNWFALHGQWADCSGWIGGPAGSKDVSSDSVGESGCHGTPVPEPATLTLLGTGLLGLAGAVRRRLRLKK